MPHLAKDYRLAHHLQNSTSIVVPERVIERMFSQAVLDPRTRCWNYMPSNGAKPTTGYPTANWGNKAHTAPLHRIALIVGTDAPCPDLSLLALHGCGNKRCIRPDHLRWGTAAENSADYWSLERVRRAVARGEPLSLIVTPRRPSTFLCEAA